MGEYVRMADGGEVGETRHVRGARHTLVYPPEWIAERICDADMLVTGCRAVAEGDALGETNERYTHVVRFTLFAARLPRDIVYLTTFDALPVVDLIRRGAEQSIAALERSGEG